MKRVRVVGQADVPKDVAAALAPLVGRDELHLAVTLHGGYGYTIRMPFTVTVEDDDAS